jgi:hypothetical protein
MTFQEAISEFEHWVLTPIDAVLSMGHYTQAMILASCAIDYLAAADSARSVSTLGDSPEAYSQRVGYSGSTSGVGLKYEAFCRCFLGKFGANDSRAATIYRTARCGLVHGFTTDPVDQSSKSVQALDVVLSRDKLEAVELGSPAAALLVSVPLFVEAVRNATTLWQTSCSVDAQQSFVAAWRIAEFTPDNAARSSFYTATTPGSATVGTLTSPGVLADYNALYKIKH